VVLAGDADSTNVVVAVRRHLTETTERTETMAIAAGGPNFEHIGKVPASMDTQLDAVEKRVSQLRHGQAMY
jgi:hypothetical protein